MWRDPEGRSGSADRGAAAGLLVPQIRVVLLLHLVNVVDACWNRAKSGKG